MSMEIKEIKIMKNTFTFKRPVSPRGRIASLLLLALLALPPAINADQINLNLADTETLQYIPGIGPTKAMDIIEFRKKNGEFKNLDELLQVPGIGAKTLLEIRKYGSLEGGVSRLTDEMASNPPADDGSGTAGASDLNGG